jgi:hypothetical protein
MPATNPVTPEPRRSSIRQPRPLWIGVAAMVLLVAGGGLRIALPIYRQQTAIREIERLGGHVECARGGPDWLRERLGDEPMKLFDTVTQVSLSDTAASDETLNHLRGLGGLRQLDLDGTRITDAGLAGLQRSTSLHHLLLDRTRVTDAGLAYLKALRELETLSLRDTKITDTGMAHLQRVTNLQVLYVAETFVTDGGIAELKQSVPRVRVSMVLPLNPSYSQ